MKIILDKSKCIGCGSCQAVCPKFFELREDGKSHLVRENPDLEDEKEKIEVEKVGCANQAAEVCPVQAIQIEK